MHKYDKAEYLSLCLSSREGEKGDKMNGQLPNQSDYVKGKQKLFDALHQFWHPAHWTNVLQLALTILCWGRWQMPPGRIFLHPSWERNTYGDTQTGYRNVCLWSINIYMQRRGITATFNCVPFTVNEFYLICVRRRKRCSRKALLKQKSPVIFFIMNGRHRS